MDGKNLDIYVVIIDRFKVIYFLVVLKMRTKAVKKVIFSFRIA